MDGDVLPNNTVAHRGYMSSGTLAKGKNMGIIDKALQAQAVPVAPSGVPKQAPNGLAAQQAPNGLAAQQAPNGLAAQLASQRTPPAKLTINDMISRGLIAPEQLRELQDYNEVNPIR